MNDDNKQQELGAIFCRLILLHETRPDRGIFFGTKHLLKQLEPPSDEKVTFVSLFQREIIKGPHVLTNVFKTWLTFCVCTFSSVFLQKE